MEAHHHQRLERLRDALGQASVEALWVEPSLNLTYLTGLVPLSIERIMGLIVRPEGELRIVVPKLLAEESAGVEGEAFEWDDADGPEAALASALEGIERLSVAGSLPFGVVAKLRNARSSLDVELEDAILPRLRAVKDSAEIAALEAAGAATDEVIDWIETLDLNGVTEAELAQKIAIRYIELGHHPWDELLVASGPNASMPHYGGGDFPIAMDQPLLVDIGAAVGGYQSDTTRVYFPENTDPEVERVYTLLIEAYQAAFDAAAPGIPAQEVDRAARKVIAEAGYGDNFIHRTGHGVGMDIHEDPYIREGNEVPLEAGNVFSIEPGIYVPGRFGLRYENLVVLGPGGPSPLNRSKPRHRLG